MMRPLLPSKMAPEPPPARHGAGCLVVDARGCIRLLDTGAAELIGRPQAELTGMPVDEVLRPAGADPRDPGAWWLTPSAGGPIDIAGAGQDPPLRARVRRLEGAEGAGSLLELWSEPGAEPAERAGERQDAAWLDSFELAIGAGFDGRLVAVSHSFARKFGQPTPAWPGRAVTELVHPDDAGAWTKAAARLQRSGRRETLESRWLTPQGWRWIAWELGLRPGAGRGADDFRATGTDVTMRRLAEEQYRRLAGAVEQSPVAILITDPEGRVQYVNRKFSESTGCSLEDILDRNLDPLRAGHPTEQAYQEFRRAIRETGEWRGELAQTRPNGRAVWESVQVSAMRNERGAVTNLLCLREDITARKQLEDQLRQAQKMEDLGTLAGGIAHDFNNMLAIVRGYADICLEHLGDRDPKLSRFVREIRGASERATGLVRQILTFSRKTEIEFGPVCLPQLIRSLTALMRETFPRTVAFDLDLDEALPDLRGDQNQLQQVVMNLCVNARDAMPSGGTLALRLRRIAGSKLAGVGGKPALDYAHLEVRDTGTGMTPEVRARIFEPFFTTKHDAGGTGLGLAVVYGIILGHDGLINVDSAPGQGSTFHVYLPFGPVEAGAPELGAELAEFPTGHESILVVEDEPSLRGLLSQVLEARGYRVRVVATGLEATELIASGQAEIDLMLLDFNLPGLNGIGVCRAARACRPDLKIIVISGNLNADARAEFARLGQHEFLEKPYRLEDVGLRIRKLLAPAKS